MKIYLVGGAVRDELLGRQVLERDYVVVGADEKKMLSLEYKKVGKEFPVFLHPSTKEEYALARREKKIGAGYTGFQFEANADVTLEQDLLRRDLTVNAMAKDENGVIIDPYGGRQDLDNKLLSHVSEAFVEDPVRVLRVARFAARYAHLGFRVAPETNHLMYTMVKNGELSSLVPERVWQETEKALTEKTPSIFFQVLRDCGALSIIFPELDALFGVPATKVWHGEIDTGVHTLMVLEEACVLTDKPEIRWAALLHDLGKAVTPFDILPSHHGHDARGVELVDTLCERYRVPKRYQSLAVIASKYHTLLHKVQTLRPSRVVSFLEELDAYRRPERFFDFITVCKADALGRLGDIKKYTQADYLLSIYHELKSISLDSETKMQMKGQEIKQLIYQKRIKKTKQWIKEKS